MYSSILVATLLTAVSALHVDPLANSSSSLASDNGGSLRARAICGNDDSIEAKCADFTTSTTANKINFGWSYHFSKAVLRMSGDRYCTAFLVGHQGHILTNNHCVSSSYQAKKMTFEAMAEGANCATNCKTTGSCAGTVIHQATVDTDSDSHMLFVATGSDDGTENDWTLLQLPSKKLPKDAKGNDLPYLRIRKTGAVVGERVYSVGHPQGWGKRISLKGPREGGFAKIVRTEEGVAFFDTDGLNGSSGGPVLSYRNEVVALVTKSNSRCGTGTNGNSGASGDKLFAALKNRLPASAWA
jgi:hypothetical protein